MSGVMDFVRPKPILQGPIEKKLALEDNRRIVRSIGAGQVAGAWFVAWVFTLSPIFPPILTIDPPLPNNDSLVVRFDPTPRLRPGPKKPPVNSQPNHGRVAQSANPVKTTGVIRHDVLEARTDKLLDKAFRMIKDIGHGIDQEKIERAGGLTRTDQTRLSGRAGVKRDGFNLGYNDGDGSSNDIDISATRWTNTIKTDDSRLSEMGKTSQITLGEEERFRSSDEILAVVRSHAPGLRHLYNTHLKMNPGMNGKVTIRFAISPSGRVVDAAIASGTTGSRRFEEDVLRKIMVWRFESIKAHGNDIVTVPFNFSE